MKLRNNIGLAKFGKNMTNKFMNIIRKITTWYFSKSALPYWCVLILDCLIIVFSGMFAVYITDGGTPLQGHGFWMYLGTFIYCLPMFIIGMKLFRTYSGVMRYSSFIDLSRILFAFAFGFVTNCLIVIFIPDNIVSHSHLMTLIVMSLISLMLMFSLRILVKTLFLCVHQIENAPAVYIYGIREGGIGLAKSILNEGQSRYKIKGFVSDDGELVGRYLLGAKVYSIDDKLVPRMILDNTKCLFVSPLYNKAFRDRQDLVTAITDAGIRIMMMPVARKFDANTKFSHEQLREVDIEDILPRDEINVDMDAIGRLLSGKVILITGAAGSIGSEMVRQIAVYNPKELILIDQSETPMHDVRLRMINEHSDIRCETIVASITNQTRMESIFSNHRPDFVFHAAAYKHVPMMEDNPSEAVQNNVYGTRVIADLAVKYGAKKFVMISTDKAVNPTNVMGCSKRICEIYCQSLNKSIVNGEQLMIDGTPAVTQFVTTRFGNVLGSNGSVIPIFREQIKNGGPVTVTDPEIIRFFMLIPEACKLVLEAGTMGKGGEIFVFDMGKPVRIAELAKRMIKLSGARNIEIKYTGLRDGEKLFEEVLNDAETTKNTVHPKIMIASVREYEFKEVLREETRLYKASFDYDDMATVKIMKEIVPEFKSNQSKYQALD